MTVGVLLRCPEEDMDINETLYIEKLDTVYPRGYNLRCGNLAASAVSQFKIINCQHTPVVYTDDAGRESVEQAVREAINDILFENGYKPWSGPIQMSVTALNKHRGAKQNCAWAGSVSKNKDEIVDYCMSRCFKKTTSFDVWDWTKQCSCMEAFSFEEYSMLLRNWEKRKLEEMRLAANKSRLEIEGQLSLIASKIEKCERLGMHEEANSLKRKLIDM